MIMAQHFLDAIPAIFLDKRFSEHNGHHGFADNASSRHNADITALVAALIDVFTTCQIYRWQGVSQGRDRLDSNVYDDRFAIGDTPFDAACVIGEMEPCAILSMTQHIMDMRACSTSCIKARADLHTLSRWNTHHCHRQARAQTA